MVSVNRTHLRVGSPILSRQVQSSTPVSVGGASHNPSTVDLRKTLTILCNFTVKVRHGHLDETTIVSDSWLKGCEIKSRHGQPENFLLQSHFSVLTFIRCPFHPSVAAVPRKRPRSFCQKCRWQVTPKHAYTLGPTQSAWAYYAARCTGIVWKPTRKTSSNAVREHSATIVAARWATVDWWWLKEWNWCEQTDLHFLKKRRRGLINQK